MTTPIKHARPEDLAAAADTLAAAFEHYPWTRYVIPESGYADRLRELQGLYLDYAHTHGLVAVTVDRDGVIAVLPPEAPAPGQGVIDRILELHGDRAARLEHTEPPPHAWRLETLGVRPDSQGRGYASALITFAVREVAQRGGSLIALETSDPRNVRLYERHGFVIDAQRDDPERPPIWRLTATLNDSAPDSARTRR
ncbi:GNAT family N-acetyltransferase [Microbacterium suaedae]|uniref:GNAT family N-acetyltransferase n=1 Tax=Microbacterium suaedae TaxID=2067813 RepID=UPI000DA1A9F3|nr:GNAT family N-acetyltransferase [Microbacterium suaedae]